MARLRAASAWTFLVLASVGCKETDGDQTVKSLDNLSSGRETINECRGSYGAENRTLLKEALTAGRLKLPASLIVDGEAAAPVQDAFSAIPAKLARELFHTAEISYVDAASLGGKRYEAVDEPITEGAERVAKTSLRISASPRDIRHATVLAAMGVVLNRIAYLKADERGNAILQDTKDEDFERLQRSLVVYLVHDAAKGGTFDLASIRQNLPQDPQFFAKETTVEGRAGIWDAWASQNSTSATKVKDLVFWNAADSFYCSDKTRANLEKNFRSVNDLMKEDFDAAVASAPTSGLDLWGRWGFGNGPLRQLFSNRVQQTGFLFPRLHGYTRPLDGSFTWVDPNGMQTMPLGSIME